MDVYEFRLGMWLSTHTADFCANVSQREMARRLGMGNGVTERALRGLETLGIVVVERPGNTRSVAVSFDVEAWERIGQLTPSGSELTPSGSVTDPERVTKGIQGGLQESSRSSTSSPPSRPRQRDEIWDALVAYVGPVEMPQEKTRRGKIVKQLKALGATVPEVERRCAEYRRKWPRSDLTDTALANHWSKLVPKPARQRTLNGNAMDPMMAW